MPILTESQMAFPQEWQQPLVEATEQALLKVATPDSNVLMATMVETDLR